MTGASGMAILFDLSGTLLDGESRALETIGSVIREYTGNSMEGEDLAIFRERSLLEVLWVWYPDRADEIYSAVMKRWQSTNIRTVLYPGIEQAIAEISEKGIAMGVVSSMERDSIMKSLSDFGISDRFSVFIGGDSTEKGKPSPDPLLKACSELGANPAESLYIGDQPGDIRAAHDAGMKGAAALWGLYDSVEIEKARPDYMLKDPSEISGKAIPHMMDRTGR